MSAKPLEDLVRTLQDENSSSDLLCDVARELATLQDPRATLPLMRRLLDQSDDYPVRRELVNALGFLDGTESAKLLLQIFLSELEHKEVRGAAALSLGWIGYQPAVGALLATLKSGDKHLAYSCITALGELRDVAAIELLADNLKVDDFLIPQVAAEALGKFGPAAEQALPELETLAKSANQVQRRFALDAIAKIRFSNTTAPG